jgi:hypothetical protein
VPDKRQSKRLHVRTGRRKGASVGSSHALKHGLKSAAAVAHRKAFVALMRDGASALRQTD